MAEFKIRFDDGAGYERMMGDWSRLAGDIFLDWLAPPPGLRWVDIGCGNGAFTELIVERCAPTEVQGIDPSQAQLAFARTRPAARVAHFQQGEAMALPFPEHRFDGAVMALVLFFVPYPAKGIAEMGRVVRPGGAITAYLWDLPGGFPMEPVQAEMRAMGFPTLRPPSADASRMDVLGGLWTDAGLEQIETREITVRRGFPDFDDLWATCLLSPSVAAVLATMASGDVERLKERLHARLPADAGGRITYGASANAIKGRVPIRR
jgi:SAM-dependent methyltransferase